MPATPEHFLAVEDDEVIRRAIGRGANGLLEPRFAETGKAALDALGGELPRFVLLDYMLPDMDGLQVLRRLRSDARWARLPIVMFSSVKDPARIQATLEAGADAWVPKPDDPEALRDAVRRLCTQWGHLPAANGHGVGSHVLVPALPKPQVGYAGHRFRLVWDGLAVAGADACGPLRRTTEALARPAGTGSDGTLPNRTSFEALVLRGVVTHDQAFERWAARPAPGGRSEGRPDLVVEARDGTGRVVQSCRLLRCWVSEYEGALAPGPDGAVEIHLLRLEHEGWERGSASGA
ncbi:MAG: response regulator [Thermoplasmatota archaeon]